MPHTKDIIAIKVELLLREVDRTAVTPTTSVSADDVRTFLTTWVEFGESLPFSDHVLYELCDLDAVKQCYKFLMVDKGVGTAAGKAGKKRGVGGQRKTKHGDVQGEVAAPGERNEDVGKLEWQQGGESIQRDLEVWAMGAMVLRAVG